LTCFAVIQVCVIQWLVTAMRPTLGTSRSISRRQVWILAFFSTLIMATSLLSATDIVLSCSICQAPLSSIYNDDDQNNGLRKGDGPYNGRVTKLWLTECTHLTCAKHLEGGGRTGFIISTSIDELIRRHPGLPFHSDQQPPRAPCPLCIAEKNDCSNKDLFYIDGIAEGEYDSNIPDAYFQTPPVSLGGGDDPPLDALLAS
jgi:hypothetical protein